MSEKLTVSPENAPKFLEWLKTRGGLAIWRSIDLSDPGASCTTPVNGPDGKPATKPHWKYAEKPERIITDAAEVEVVTAKEVKRFHVAVRRGAQGFKLKLTDASSEKLRAACKRAGPESWYEFDYGAQEAVIFVPDKKIPLSEWR